MTLTASALPPASGTALSSAAPRPSAALSSEAPPPSAPAFPDVRFLVVPDRRVLVVDRTGDPGGQDGYPATMQALYPVAYTIKFALKARGIRMKVGMPEGLFEVEGSDPSVFVTGAIDPTKWVWAALIEVPEVVSQADLESARQAIRAKKRRPAPALLDDVRLETLAEGLVAEIMHIGSYDAEGPTIARLHGAIEAAGLRPRGRHHEIYLGDPRRTGPDKLKTIIRQPAEPG